MTREEIEAAKAAFLAKGGKVQQVAEGDGAGLTPSDWRRVIQNPGYTHIRTDADAYAEIERQSEDYMQRVREERGYHGK